MRGTTPWLLCLRLALPQKEQQKTAACMVKRDRVRPRANAGTSGGKPPLVDLPSVRLREASGLWRTGRHADALVLFEEAMREEPNNVQTYVAAARAYADKFYFDRMEQTHERLVRRAPQHPGIHHYIGET